MLKKVLKINLKVLGAIILGLILVQIVSAYFFGIIAEKQFETQFVKMTDSKFIKVVNKNYSRSWFTSEMDVTLAVNNQAIKNFVTMLPLKTQESSFQFAESGYQLSYKTHITNGLFAGWMHGNILPTIAYSTTDLAFPESINSVLKTFFKDEQPLQISNILYLNNSGKYKIFSPSFDYQEALSGVKVNWGGLKWDVAYDNKFNKFENSFSVPNLDFSAPTKGDISFKNLYYTANSSRSIHDIKVGNTMLDLEKFSINLTESSTSDLKLGEVIRVFTGINSADFLNGLDVINPTRFTLSEVYYKSVSSDENNFFAANVQAGFESLVSNKLSYGPMVFDFSLDHILADKFSAVVDTLNDEASLTDAERDAHKAETIQLLKNNLTPIFIESPVVELNKLTVKTPTGLITLSGKATMHGFESADMNDKTKFMSRLSLKVNFSIPKPVMSYLFLLQMKYFLTAGNAQMDQQSSDALAKVVNILLDNQLQVWQKKGFIQESAGNLSSVISMESGVMSLNGHPTTN